MPQLKNRGEMHNAELIGSTVNQNMSSKISLRNQVNIKISSPCPVMCVALMTGSK